jgi:hypothetical protein
MDIETLCTVLVLLQPLVVYYAFYKNTGVTTKDNEFNQSFLVISPSFAFFYLDQYWYALSFLVGVALLGLLLAMIVDRKASHPIDYGGLVSFMLAWLIIFGIGHWIAGFFPDSSSTEADDTIALTDITQGGYSALTSSLYYFLIMLGVFFVRIIEKKYFTKDNLSSLLLFISSVVGGVLPMVGDYFILSIVINFFILFYMSVAIIRLDDTGPSSGSVTFIFSYLFMMGASLAIMIKGGYWLYSLMS